MQITTNMILSLIYHIEPIEKSLDYVLESEVIQEARGTGAARIDAESVLAKES